MVDPIVMGGTLWVSAIPDDSHMLCYAVLGRFRPANPQWCLCIAQGCTPNAERPWGAAGGGVGD